MKARSFTPPNVLTQPARLARQRHRTTPDMHTRHLCVAMLLITATAQPAQAQYSERDSTYRKFYLGSTLFMLANAVPDDNPPKLIYLNAGYRVTRRDVVSLEFKTWRYGWPIGIPWGKSFEAPGEGFPGHITDRGVSVNYQRFVWKRAFIRADVMPSFQTFADEDGHKIDDGFQVFNTYSVGYHIKLFKDRMFLQPSIGITHRPYQSTMPPAFKLVDDRWSRFFYGEPGLHFGFNF
ncbi:MAG: hypothetical protein IT355_20855 [Gemmatimonadaceae bacterium]|nr:hypothetical protein [Gemmatimonadaceae bacterium]